MKLNLSTSYFSQKSAVPDAPHHASRINCVHVLPVWDLLDADGTKPEHYSGKSAPCRML